MPEPREPFAGASQGGLPPAPSSFLGSPDSAWLRQVLAPPRHPLCLGSLDRYDILDRIGLGGMGCVLLARDSRSTPLSLAAAPPTAAETLLAVKLLKPELAANPRAVAFFAKEPRRLAQLDHPHILKVIDVSDQPGRPYFVTRYLRRGSLAGLLRAGQPLEAATVLRLAQGTAEALAYAHDRGLVHRDLKPANLLLDDGGEPVLCDFGLALAVGTDSLLDVTQVRCEGTAHYLAPEVVAGKMSDMRGDIYAFGALLYEMLTGQPPYDEGRTTQEVLSFISARPPRPILELNPTAPRGLVQIAERAMARELEARYAHLSYALADLRRVAAGGTPEVRASIRLEPPRPRRSPALAVAGFCGVILLSLLALALVRKTSRLPTEVAGSGLPFALIPVREFPLPGSDPYSHTRVLDWDGDGRADILQVSGHTVRVLTSSGEPIRSQEIEAGSVEAVQFNGRYFVNRELTNALFLSWRDQSDLCLGAFNDNLSLVRQFRLPKPMRKERAGYQERLDDVAAVHAVGDFDRDGRIEVLASLNAGLAKNPRAIVCLDYESGQEKWRYATAARVSSVVPVAFQGEGTNTIVFTTSAVSNTNSAPDGTDDFHAYLGALPADGASPLKPLWLRTLADQFHYATLIVADLDGGGRSNLLVALTADRYGRARIQAEGAGHLLRYDASGRLSTRFDLKEELTFGELLPARPGTTSKEILLATSSGRVYLLDATLAVRRCRQVVTNRYDRVFWKIVGSADLDGNGSEEIVLLSSQYQRLAGDNLGRDSVKANTEAFRDNQLLVLDRSLTLLAQYLIAPTRKQVFSLSAAVADVEGDVKPEILLLSEQVQVLRFGRR